MTKINDVIELQKQNVTAVECKDCGHLMVNIDADEIVPGDLATLKRLGLRLSNPETKDTVCLECDVPKNPTFRERLNTWFSTTDDDDDSSFFHTTPTISVPTFGGGSIGGGFGGFGGGSFSGGGASRGF